MLPRSWYLIHPWCLGPRDDDRQAYNDGIVAGLDLARLADSGDPAAVALREAIERERHAD